VRANLATFAFGAVFGFTLGWAQLHDPATIHRMLRFVEPDVFLLMGSAIATAAIGTRLLKLGRAQVWFGDGPVSWKIVKPERRHVIGSVLFGLGWGFACVCPGPAAVLIGRGHLSGLLVAAGMMVGIVVRDSFPLTSSAPRSPAPSTPPAGEIGL
jgi:uncharacterized protein